MSTPQVRRFSSVPRAVFEACSARPPVDTLFLSTAVGPLRPPDRWNGGTAIASKDPVARSIPDRDRAAWAAGDGVYVLAPQQPATASRPAPVTLQTPFGWGGMADDVIGKYGDSMIIFLDAWDPSLVWPGRGMTPSAIASRPSSCRVIIFFIVSSSGWVLTPQRHEGHHERVARALPSESRDRPAERPGLPSWELVMHDIIKANIDRFNRLLETETDPTKRAMLMRLLGEEEAKQRAAREEKEA